MKAIIMMLLMTFLVGCKTKIICRQIKSAIIRPLPLCDISFQFNRCRCSCFDINKFQSVNDNACTWPDGNEFKSGDYPIKTCEGVSGFFNEDWAIEVRPKIKKLARLKEDYCK